MAASSAGRAGAESKDPYNGRNSTIWPHHSDKLETARGYRGPSTPRCARRSDDNNSGLNGASEVKAFRLSRRPASDSGLYLIASDISRAAKIMTASADLTMGTALGVMRIPAQLSMHPFWPLLLGYPVLVS